MRWLLSIALLFPACALAVEPDLSSPKAAAKSLFTAINAGDRDGVRAALYAGDEQQAKLTAAMADLIVAGKKLGDAAHARFGKAGDPIGRGMLDPADLAKLEEATVNQSGDAATVLVPGQPRPMSFRRQNNQWKLVVTDFAGAAPENIQKQIKLVELMADAVDASAKEVSSGKYQTADDALNGIKQRLDGVMLAFYRPTTTRATTQATQPAPHATTTTRQ